MVRTLMFDQYNLYKQADPEWWKKVVKQLEAVWGKISPDFKELRENPLTQIEERAAGGILGGLLGGILGYSYPLWDTKDYSELLSSILFFGLLGSGLGTLSWPWIRQQFVTE